MNGFIAKIGAGHLLQLSGHGVEEMLFGDSFEWLAVESQSVPLASPCLDP